jgi:hypothetical protein
MDNIAAGFGDLLYGLIWKNVNRHGMYFIRTTFEDNRFDAPPCCSTALAPHESKAWSSGGIHSQAR